MRRSTIRWGFGVAIVVSVSGCASLLGDFTTSSETSGDDGGGTNPDGSSNTIDGAVNGDDGSLSNDGSNDGNSPQDGPSLADANDGAPAVVPLACVEQGGVTRAKLGSISKTGSNDSYRVQLFNATVGNQTRYRVLVPETPSSGPMIFHLFSFQTGGSSNSIDIPIPSNNGQVLSVKRYPGGIAALVFAQINPNDGAPASAAFEVVTLDDSANAWSAPTVLSTLANSCANRVDGALLVRTVNPPDYFAEVTYQTCASPPMTIHGAEHFTGTVTSPGFWPLPSNAIEVPDGGDAGASVDAGPAQFDLAGLAISGTGLYAMTNPSGNNGPDPSVGATLFTSTVAFNTGASPYEIPLVDDSDIMQGLSIASLANTGGVGLGILEANLNAQTVTPVIYAGNVPGSKISTLVPSKDLHATTLPSISDLPINNSTYHWESFAVPASDNLLGVGSIFPNNNGLNFLWWDGAGDLRAQRTNTGGFFYFDPTGAPGLTIYGGDVTFSSAPLGAIAGLEMAFLQSDSEASTLIDVWATEINCTPKP